MKVKVWREVVMDATTIFVNANVKYWDGEINGMALSGTPCKLTTE